MSSAFSPRSFGSVISAAMAACAASTTASETAPITITRRRMASLPLVERTLTQQSEQMHHPRLGCRLAASGQGGHPDDGRYTAADLREHHLARVAEWQTLRT